MTDEQLQSDLERLRTEVNALSEDNPAGREKLNLLISDIEKRIGESSEHDDGLIDSLKDAIHQF